MSLPAKRRAPLREQNLKSKWRWRRVTVIALMVAIGGIAATVIIGPQSLKSLLVRAQVPAVPEFDLNEVEPRVASAVVEAREAVAADQTSAQRWGDLGKVCDIHGFLAEAATCYEVAMELQPREMRWPYLLAFAHDQRDQPASVSIPLYTQALSLKPDYWPALVRRGDVHAKVHDHAKAEADFARAAQLAPNEAGVFRRLGIAQLELDKSSEAVQSLSRAAQLNPNDQSTHAALAKAYTAIGDAARAEEASRNAAASRPSAELTDPVREEVVALGVSSTIAIMRADQHMRAGAFDRARADLRIALEARPDDVAVHARLGRACAALGKRDEAAYHFKRAIEIDPTHAASHVRLGSLMNDMGNFDLAIQHLQKAVELEPDNGASRALLAITYTRSGKIDEALAEFQRSTELTAPTDIVEFNWGNALMRKGDATNAAMHYASSIALNPDQPDAHFNLGVALEQLGRTDEAIVAYQQAVNLSPQHRAREHLLRLTQR